MSIDLAKKFFEVISSEKEFFAMPTADLQRITGSKSKVLTSQYRLDKLNAAKREIDFISKNKISATYYTDETYPFRLQNAPDAPLMIYSLGQSNLNAKHIISIVGTRHATQYGRNFVDKLIEDISKRLDDTIVVSGLAYGIDIAAHNACLKYGVPTIAVLAHGLNTIYPSSHRQNAAEIVQQGGMLISDYTSQCTITKGNFVARNRIVAGLSDCTIVVESAKKGGALITANIAQSYNREVFALPGKINDEYSIGCNKLIQSNGAQLTTGLDDIVEVMNWSEKSKANQPRQKELFPEFTPEEDAIVQTLRGKEPLHINTIAQGLKQPVYKLLNTLINLEFKGIVVSLPGSRYTTTS